MYDDQLSWITKQPTVERRERKKNDKKKYEWESQMEATRQKSDAKE